MLANQGAYLRFMFTFVDSTTLQGKTGLTVTVNIYRNGSATPIATGTATEWVAGSYYYDLSSGSVNAAGEYLGVGTISASGTTLKTSYSAYTVDKAGTPYLDASVASRAAASTALSTATWTSGRAAALDYLDVAVSSRLATAGYTAPLDAAGTRSAIGLAAANLDTQLAAIDDYLDTEVAAIYSRLGAPAGASVSADIAAVKAETAAILDDTGTAGVVVAAGSKTGYSLAAAGLDSIVIETGVNARQAISVIASACVGVASGMAGTTATLKAAANSGTTRITATVDSDGNRSAVTLNLPS